MLQKIKIDNIASQYRAPVFSAGFEYKCVIKGALPLLLPIALGSGKHAGQYPGSTPNLRVGRDRPVAGAPVDDRRNLSGDSGRPGVSGVQQTASHRQFGCRYRRMPGLAQPQRQIAVPWKAALKDVNIDGRIVQQFLGMSTGHSDEFQVRLGTRIKLYPMPGDLQPSERVLKVRTQDRSRDL